MQKAKLSTSERASSHENTLKVKQADERWTSRRSSTLYASRIKSFKLLTMRDTTFQVHRQNLERSASLPANVSYFRG